MNNLMFIDTNLWIYLYAKDPEDKFIKVRDIVINNLESLVISTQVLGEIFNVLTRKKLVEQNEAQEIIIEIITNFSIVEIDAAKVVQALAINSKYGYSYWDSQIIATALLTDCSILYSEDMQHNQMIENKTRIINPFL